MKEVFQYDNVNNVLDINMPEILLVREFKALWNDERNITKTDKKGTKKSRAFREFAYIWLAIDWKSIYADYTEGERHEYAMLDAQLTEEEFNDPVFRAACRKYRELQEENRSLKMLQAAQNTVDKFIDYFNNIDPEERDPVTGKPIFKVKDIMTEINTLHKVHEQLALLEGQVKKDLAAGSSLRGGAEDGYQPLHLK